MTSINVAAAVATLATRADIHRRMTPHTLHHAAITAALNAGAHLRDVQDFARHADHKTTSRAAPERPAHRGRPACRIAVAVCTVQGFRSSAPQRAEEPKPRWHGQ